MRFGASQQADRTLLVMPEVVDMATGVAKRTTRMPRNRSRMPLELRIVVRQVRDSGSAKPYERPLGNRACCVKIGK